MDIFVLNEHNKEEAIARVAEVVRIGCIAVVPTDTVYGLVCDAQSPDAVAHMFRIKQRPDERAFPVFIRDIAMARQYAYISDAKARFLERVWPGAVTVVFQHKEKLPLILTGGKNTIGIRVPDYPFLLELLAGLDAPLAQTSANISDMPPAKNKEEIQKYFQDKEDQPDLIIDAGEVSGVSSTVVDFTRESPIIARSGMISKKDIDNMLKDF